VEFRLVAVGLAFHAPFSPGNKNQESQQT
jgi:hypothetical protein